MKRIIRGLIIIALIVGFIIVFAIYLRPNLVISKVVEKARYAVPEFKFIHWRGAEIHYTDTGKGPVILMLHGFGGNFTNFTPLANLLQDSFRVIRVDLPGFGMSDMPEMPDSPRNYIGMYRRFGSFLIDHLQLDSVYVVGNSMGGWLGWELAVQRPDKVNKLVLLNSAGYENDKAAKNSGIKYLRSSLVQKLMERGFPLWASEKAAHRIRAGGEPVNMEEVKESNALINREGSMQCLFALANSNEQPDTTRIPKVSCPTLIIWGKEDPILPYQHAFKFRRDIPRSKVIIYDDCGHVPMQEYPDKLAGDIRKFLK